MKRVYAGLVIAMSLLFSSICWSNDIIEIGVAGPLSGSYAAFGEQFWRGAQQAVDDLNNSGGLGGKALQVVIGDDACDPKKTEEIAHRLASIEKVNAVVGHFCSASSLLASSIYKDSNILMVTPGSTNPQITERRYPNVIRLAGRDDQQGVIAFDFMQNTLHAKSIAIVHDEALYGRDLADAVQTAMKLEGKTPILYAEINQGGVDFSPVVKQIEAARPDVVYFGGLHPEAAVLLRQIREAGLSMPFVAGDGIASDDFVIEAGGPEVVKGVYMTFAKDARTLAQAKSVIARLRDKGYEPEGYTLYAYASVQAIAEAIQATQSVEGNVLSHWLKTNTVNSILGPLTWDEKGDLKGQNYIIYEWDDTGHYQAIKG